MLGLCICYYNFNFGSMLQAYATVKEIEKRGIDYRIISYKKRLTLGFAAKNVFRIFNSAWRGEKKLIVQKKLSRMIVPEYAMNVRIRNAAFQAFMEENFDKKVFQCYGYDQLRRSAEKFDAFLVGSDQMWSPSGLATNFYNLMFVPDEKKKISYASSFGVSEIPFYQKKRTAEFLNRIDYLSVRENVGVKIIRDLTGRDALVTVDPTMLLTAQEWDEFSGGDRLSEEKYIFAYFLGNNPEFRRIVKELQRKTGLKIITLRHLDEYIPQDEQFGDEAPYNLRPEGFVNLMKNAEYVCTDSFHGSVFSSLFHRQFVVFPRYSETASLSRNSRISSLLNNLGLEKRLYNPSKAIDLQADEPICYELVEIKRRKLIEKSLQFLDEAIGARRS